MALFLERNEVTGNGNGCQNLGCVVDAGKKAVVVSSSFLLGCSSLCMAYEGILSLFKAPESLMHTGIL